MRKSFTGNEHMCRMQRIIHRERYTMLIAGYTNILSKYSGVYQDLRRSFKQQPQSKESNTSFQWTSNNCNTSFRERVDRVQRSTITSLLFVRPFPSATCIYVYVNIYMCSCIQTRTLWIHVVRGMYDQQQIYKCVYKCRKHNVCILTYEEGKVEERKAMWHEWE